MSAWAWIDEQPNISARDKLTMQSRFKTFDQLGKMTPPRLNRMLEACQDMTDMDKSDFLAAREEVLVKATLKGAYEVFLEIKGMQGEVVANQKSLNLLISRFSGVAEGVKVLAERGASDNVKLQPARNFAALVKGA